MRIAFVSTILGYPWGSPDRLWSGMAERCLLRGDSVLLGISALTANCEEVRNLERLGAKVVLRGSHSAFLGRIDRLSRQLPGRRDGQIDLQLREFSPDIVVVTQGGTHDVIAETYLTRWLESSDMPYVVICHNYASGNRLSAAELKELGRTLANASRILFVSSLNRRCAERELQLEFGNAGLIQNPLAFADRGPLEWPEMRETAEFGLIGRIDVHHKGIDLLFEALASIKSLFPLRVTLTGRCDDTGTLAALVDKFALSGHVRISNHVVGSDIAGCYRRLECQLLTSRYEGCASAMVEGLMCGRPVVATPVGGVDDWVEDGVSGFIAPAISADAIYGTLVNALTRRDEWRSMGYEARRSFESRRDADPVRTLIEMVDSIRPPATIRSAS